MQTRLHGVQDVRLIKPTRDLKDDFLAMAEEFGAEGSGRFGEALEDFESYFLRREDCAPGSEPPGWVPYTAFWLVRDGATVLGRSSACHRLNSFLIHEGGHIGYCIRPSERRKGYGTLILALTLGKAKEIGLPRVLLTCNSDNIASRRTIEKNNGVLENQVISHDTGKPVLRFWIDLSL